MDGAGVGAAVGPCVGAAAGPPVGAAVAVGAVVGAIVGAVVVVGPAEGAVVPHDASASVTCWHSENWLQQFWIPGQTYPPRDPSA